MVVRFLDAYLAKQEKTTSNSIDFKQNSYFVDLFR